MDFQTRRPQELFLPSVKIKYLGCSVVCRKRLYAWDTTLLYLFRPWISDFYFSVVEI